MPRPCFIVGNDDLGWFFGHDGPGSADSPSDAEQFPSRGAADRVRDLWQASCAGHPIHTYEVSWIPKLTQLTPDPTE